MILFLEGSVIEKIKYIQSIKKATDILRLFMKERNPLSLTDFSQKLSIPKTTVLGIVQTMVGLNLLEKDSQTSRYSLGPLLFQLGMRYAANIDLLTVAKVWMERLCLMFNEPVNAGFLINSRISIIFRVEPEKEFSTLPLKGAIIPSHTSCVGKSYFAFMDSERRDKLLKDYSFDPVTRNSITSRQQFEEELEKVRETGVAFENEENIPGLSGIGAPIFNHIGDVIVGFAVSGDTANINKQRKKIIEEVLYTSRNVSAHFGYTNEEKRF
ncbi:MAG: IclR family transcriptional regulator [bacterium]|nr:IclR family transcriptional regulator [bacterium]